MTQTKSILAYCRWCTNGMADERINCPITTCPLYNMRLGTRPLGNHPLKAIRAKCLDCSSSLDSVRNCKETDCNLYPFRMGKKLKLELPIPPEPIALNPNVA